MHAMSPTVGAERGADLRARLRREVGMLRRRQTRRRFDAVVEVGVVDGPRRSATVPAAVRPLLDPGTRSALVTTLLEEYVGQPIVESRPPAPEPSPTGGSDKTVACPTAAWLVRPGEPVLQDDDLAWLSAADRAFASSGAELAGFYVITRTGWLDVRSEESRTWKRLRL
jgi:hypothetical protein